MSSEVRAPHRLAEPSIQSSDRARFERWLPPLLSALAGTVDVISFLSLKLFTAHVTGNFVVIAALLVRGGPPNVNQILAVPVFIFAVSGVWLIAKALDTRGAALARPLLLIQFLLLTCVLVLCVAYDSAAHPHGLVPSIAAMIAVSAMACQFSLLRLAVPGAPSTAVMTGNLTKTVLSLLDTLSERPVEEDARDQLKKTLQLIVPFFCGCLAGAAARSWLGDWAWSLPVVLAGVALTLIPSGAERLKGGSAGV
jgi:uncharacterized membrane protein YoaK (UPF0700 family)